MVRFVSLAALLVLLSCTAAQDGVSLHPLDTSVGVGDSIPLSCATTSHSPPSWNRSASSLPESSRVNISTYTANSGTVYQIATLFLCDVGFGDDGTYVCTAYLDTATVELAVHTSSIRYIQLQLNGVQNCGQYLVDDLARSTKIEELSSLILSEPLASLCPTATSSCLITEQFFDCNEDLSASSVTFRARLEHRSTDSAVAANAFPLVAEIESWVMQTSAITLNSQRLRFVTSCAVGISDATASYCPAIAGASGLSTDSGTVLGGTIGAVVGVCVVTIIIILVLQIVCLKAMKDSSRKFVPQQIHSASSSSSSPTADIHMSTIKNDAYATTSTSTGTANVAYGVSLVRPPPPPTEGANVAYGAATRGTNPPSTQAGETLYDYELIN